MNDPVFLGKPERKMLSKEKPILDKGEEKCSF